MQDDIAMKILVIEDDLVYRTLFQRMFTNLGHQVTVVESGETALAKLNDEYYPVVVTDWLMPGMDGLAVCREIRKRKQKAYSFIIMVTAQEGKQNLLDGMQAGADDFINKPVDQDVIAARLNVASRILGLMQENQQLQKLLPICSYCNKIRDDQNYWHGVERYISEHLDAKLSHGICPSCWESVVKPQLENEGLASD